MIRSLYEKIREMCSRRKYYWIIPAYALFYIYAFRVIETLFPNYRYIHLIKCPLDDLIPYREEFVIFYLSWFVFMLLSFGWFVFIDPDIGEYYRFFFLVGTGMTIFVIVSAVWPNGLAIRPNTFDRNTLFSRMATWLYLRDTPTNVFPSIHVYNSLAVYLAARDCRMLRNRPWVVRITGVWALLIILSTMFLKQHSVYDVTAGVLLCLLFYRLYYGKNSGRIYRNKKAEAADKNAETDDKDMEAEDKNTKAEDKNTEAEVGNAEPEDTYAEAERKQP